MYLIGSDPELFLIDKQGRHVSAHDVIPGDKSSPHPVDYGAIQVDGTAAEFNIDPAQTAEEFSRNIEAVKEQLQQFVSTKNPDLFLIAKPTAVYETDYFKSLPGSAKAFGCMPDYNVYTGQATVFTRRRAPERTGGGHIHLGWTDGANTSDPAHLSKAEEVIRQMDAALYPASLIYDTDKQRRQLYGRIGAFRPKSFGVEYRPLSNAFIGDVELQKWVFNTAYRAMEMLGNGIVLQDDTTIAAYIKEIFDGKDPKLEDNVSYHYNLADTYGLPLLPEKYLAA